MHFHVTQPWVLGFLSGFFCSPCCYSPYFLVFRYHCFYGNLFQKFRREQEQNMQYIHHPRPCVTFLTGKPREKEEKKRQILEEWYLHRASFEGRRRDGQERKWSSERQVAWVGPFQMTEERGAVCSWEVMTIIWNAMPRIWQVSFGHGSDPELFSSVGSVPISDHAA